MIKNLNSIQPQTTVTPNSGGLRGISSKDADLFKGILGNELSKGLEKTDVNKTEGLKFSGHAIERLQSRGISLQPDDLKKLYDAVDKAQQKGSKDTLVVMGENAFVVSVKNKTVVTAMDKNLMKENVFTNIDSTVFA